MSLPFCSCGECRKANWSIINDGTNVVPGKSIALAKIISKG